MNYPQNNEVQNIEDLFPSLGGVGGGKKSPSILFICLTAFSTVGGLEKFNQSLIKALQNLSIKKLIQNKAYSLYDNVEKTSTALHFRGFGGSRIKFIIQSIVNSFSADILIVGHINLAIIPFIVRFLNPSKKIILITHGIDVFGKQNFLKRKVLEQASTILTVSHYTKEKILEINKALKAEKIIVFHNCIEDQFAKITNFSKPDFLIKRYNLQTEEPIIQTITRLNAKEGYKGYDRVIEALPLVKKIYPNIRYLITGKSDEIERKRLEHKIEELELINNVVLVGFVKNEELISHYLLSDVFVMPSTQEGFGIAFIEAAACGNIVIAGNADGSVDALQNGKLGILINPLSIEQIADAIIDGYKKSKILDPIVQQKAVIDSFSFSVFEKKLQDILLN